MEPYDRTTELTLPLWSIERVGSKLGITCPSCKGKALVSRQWLKARVVPGANSGKVTIIGRSCTYCMKTARIK